MSRFLPVRTAATAVCVALLVGRCGGTGGSGKGTSGGLLVGAGSTFVFPLVAKWIPDYSKKHGVTITYGPIGSGGDIEQVTNRTVDFGASDVYAITDGQKFGPALEFAPLPQKIVDVDKQTIRRTKKG